MNEQNIAQTILLEETLTNETNHREYSLKDSLRNVELSQMETERPGTVTIRVKETSPISPNLSSPKIFAALHESRLQNAHLRVAIGGLSQYGTTELDIVGKSGPERLGASFEIVELAKFGHARLIGSPGTNILILTTEPAKTKFITTRRGIQEDDLREARRWMNDKSLTISNETIISVVHIGGPKYDIESISFAIRAKS